MSKSKAFQEWEEGFNCAIIEDTKVPSTNWQGNYQKIHLVVA